MKFYSLKSRQSLMFGAGRRIRPIIHPAKPKTSQRTGRLPLRRPASRTKIISLALFISAYSGQSFAQSNTLKDTTVSSHQETLPKMTLKRVVEDLPNRYTPKPTFYSVPAHQTPSGFPVPRYVSLKVGKANGRIGPSINHAVAWQYRRKGLPLIVVAETQKWRKVRDVNGDESWIYAPALSGERRAIALNDTPLRVRGKMDARIKAIMNKGVMVKIEDCRKDGWCKFKSPQGLKGWALNSEFWGAVPLRD